MAQYKVLQDIEAEDKLVGPLTLRQFIYAGITALCLYICFIGLAKHVYFLVPVFLLPGILTGFFAFPWGRDQPTEVWALAKIRFLLKPRKRVWNQSGVKQLVTITAPKKIEISYTNGLTQTEVKSRLKALADTIDSRGWAIKNVTTGLYVQVGTDQSDRLVDLSAGEQQGPAVEARNTQDIFVKNNPVGLKFDQMMQKSNQAHRAHIVQSLAQNQPQYNGPQLPTPQGDVQPVAEPSDDWYISQVLGATNQSAHVITPGSLDQVSHAHNETEEEKALAARLRKQNDSQAVSYAHLHTILPLEEQKALSQQAAKAAAVVKAKQAAAAMTPPPDPAIIALASNNDLNVATIARQAKRQNQTPPDEVIISLH